MGGVAAPSQGPFSPVMTQRTGALRPLPPSPSRKGRGRRPTYRIGENADGITKLFSCFTITPGGFRAGQLPPAAAAARTLNRSFASL